ncbi:MAG TPA: hypothetical protein DCR55_11845 [Lentisphaeria bacterium]|nr:hypothetical protein [Lentisphaeria bacterium]
MKLRKYQAILIVDDRKFDDGGDAFMESVGEVITELGGTLDASENLGRRQMAHPIRRRNSATYWELLLTLPAHEVVNLKDRYRLNNVVFRLEVFLFDRPELFSKNPAIAAQPSSAI